MADFDIVVLNSPVDGEDAQFAQAAHAPAIRSEQQVNNNGSHIWASGIGIGKANGESSSNKRRGDCEASEDKGVPHRCRIDPPSTQTRLNQGGSNRKPIQQNVIRQVAMPPRNSFIGMVLDATPPAVPLSLEMYFRPTMGMGLSLSERKEAAYIFERQKDNEGHT
ncbi:hypothetical protein PIB30_006473 [Stylosanthes scabra]|uniref:Uncharacterized protein n=1 Tax=Stylosanthes scabra TaxID=79078 RepID=A0ABU6V7C8_9FABA|nr:hypothetical protein [Stylosanthes scabra]